MVSYIRYDEYVHCFVLKQSIKRMLKVLNLPVDEVFIWDNINEESLFLRHWDIATFGLNDNTYMSKMWLDKQQDLFLAPS